MNLSKNAFYGSLAASAVAGAVVVLLVPSILTLFTDVRSVSFNVVSKGNKGQGHVDETSIRVNAFLGAFGVEVPSYADLMKKYPNENWPEVIKNRVHIFAFPYGEVDPYRCYYSSGGYAWYDEYNPPPGNPPVPPCP